MIIWSFLLICSEIFQNIISSKFIWSVEIRLNSLIPNKGFQEEKFPPTFIRIRASETCLKKHIILWKPRNFFCYPVKAKASQKFISSFSILRSDALDRQSRHHLRPMIARPRWNCCLNYQMEYPVGRECWTRQVDQVGRRG